MALWVGNAQGQSHGEKGSEGPNSREETNQWSRRTTQSGPSKQIANRFREGTELKNRPGRFQLSGDRLTFFLGDERVPLQTLENLALERVARVIGDSRDPNQLQWVIYGVVTEYQGENYLMIQRATVEVSPRD